MVQIIVNENLLLIKINKITTPQKAGVLLLPATALIPKGEVGATTSRDTEFGIFLEIVQVGRKLDSEFYKVGNRIKLQDGYFSSNPRLSQVETQLYTGNKDDSEYMFVDPRTIACMFDYTNEMQEIKQSIESSELAEPVEVVNG